MQDFKLSADPYEGARRAFFALNPDSTDEQWELWAEKHTSKSERGFDDFAALANVCGNALNTSSISEPETKQLLLYSQGYFEGLEKILRAAWISARRQLRWPVERRL